MIKTRILYIEDNAVSMSLIRKMFRLMDYELLEARDALTGIQRAAEEQPDLILTDLYLPDINGWEMTTLLKNSSRTAHIPIIMLTADTSPANYKQAVHAGCDGYLNKPVSRATLLRTIQHFLKAASIG